MERIDLFKGIRIEPSATYFLQAVNIGIEGKVVGIEGANIILESGREYDLREVIGLGYEATEKYNFNMREIPMSSIRIFRKK